MLLAAFGALVTVSLGVRYAGDHGPSPLDSVLALDLIAALSRQPELLRLLVAPSRAWVLVPVLLVAAVAAALGRRWDALALVVTGPALAVALNTWVLKPVFGRHYGDHLAYPSGHTVSLVAVCTVLAVCARPGVATVLSAVIGALLTVAAGAGMIVLGYHYATDIVGGAAFSSAVVLALAAVLRALSPPRRHPAARPRPERAR